MKSHSQPLSSVRPPSLCFIFPSRFRLPQAKTTFSTQTSVITDSLPQCSVFRSNIHESICSQHHYRKSPGLRHLWKQEQQLPDKCNKCSVSLKWWEKMTRRHVLKRKPRKVYVFISHLWLTWTTLSACTAPPVWSAPQLLLLKLKFKSVLLAWQWQGDVCTTQHAGRKAKTISRSACAAFLTALLPVFPLWLTNLILDS